MNRHGVHSSQCDPREPSTSSGQRWCSTSPLAVRDRHDPKLSIPASASGIAARFPTTARRTPAAQQYSTPVHLYFGIMSDFSLWVALYAVPTVLPASWCPAALYAPIGSSGTPPLQPLEGFVRVRHHHLSCCHAGHPPPPVVAPPFPAHPRPSAPFLHSLCPPHPPLTISYLCRLPQPSPPAALLDSRLPVPPGLPGCLAPPC